MAGTTDKVWRAHDTTPGAIDEALRRLLAEVHQENPGYVPARVLNLVCVVDREYSGEIANRLRGVGRFHASRTVIVSVSPRRTTIDAVATITAPSELGKDEYYGARENVVVEVGEHHLAHLDRVVDPLVVTDLPTLVWSPHGHEDAVDSVLGLAQVVLLDSVDEPDLRDAVRIPKSFMEHDAYVVDLAWLRSTPWRERVAATFDPEHLRPQLRMISAVTVRHHPDSAIAGLLLIGWLGSRLEWTLSPLVATAGPSGPMNGKAHARRQDVALRLEPTREQSVRGLAGLTIEIASGRMLRLDRGAGGLRARYRNDAKDTEREWTVIGASRGEAGILGEGIRQALLRDPTYRPALEAAEVLLP
jgi:glucose-6-phosphate dehydrogenase assembly protein OpcA